MTKLYTDFAEWWPLFSAPAEYAEEAGEVHRLLQGTSPAPRTLLELGSGGGNNASYLKAHYVLTLVELSPQMAAVSRALNPECEHHVGDMRDVRLSRTFDAVFVHDAIMYMTSKADLGHAFETVWVHLKPGGIAILQPDYVRETFTLTSETGGEDGDGRAIRWLEWVTDPDPADDVCNVDYVLVLKEDGRPTRVVHDPHVCGVFSRETWLTLLARQGFEARIVSDPWRQDVFVLRRPAI